MEGDPQGASVATADAGTTAAPDSALPTEPTEAGAVPAEGQTEDAGDALTSTPDDESAEDDDDAGTDTTDQTDEQKRLSRRERQRLREQERIDKAVADAIAAKEREREQAEQTRQQTAAAQKAREQASKEFEQYIGAPDEEARLSAENADHYERLRSDIGTLTQEQFDELDQKIAANKARLADIQKAKGFQDKIASNLWNGIEADILSPLAFPEFADAATKARYAQAEGGIRGALGVLRDVVRTAALAEKDAEIATIREKHQTEIKAVSADRDTWRIRAGGAEASDTTSGGTASVSAGLFTRERLATMGLDEYRRNKKEIERQELAGLIR